MCRSITFWRCRHISECPWQANKCFLMWRSPIPFCYIRPGCGFRPPQQFWVAPGTQINFILFSRGFCANQVPSGAYWYQGVFLTQRSVNPASVRILIEAASASRTVSFTDCMRFWALWTSISVACKGRGPLHHSVPDTAALPPGSA